MVLLSKIKATKQNKNPFRTETQSLILETVILIMAKITKVGIITMVLPANQFSTLVNPNEKVLNEKLEVMYFITTTW